MRTLLFVLFVGALVVPLTAHGLTIKGGQNVFTAADAKVSGTYLAAGSTIDLGGAFDDDLIVAGGTVTISGPVSGDLIVAGGTVKVTSEVKGSVRIIGGTVDVNAKVGKNVNLLGGALTLGKESEVAGETLILGGSMDIEGHAMKAVNGWGGRFTLNGQVDADVSLSTTDDCGDASCVIVGPSAVVKGNFSYRATKDAAIDKDAKISGTITKSDLAEETVTAKKFFSGFLTIARLWNLFSLLVVGTLLGLLVPKTLRQVAETMMKRSGASIGWGSLAFLASVPAFFILALTVIGIPLMLILLCLYGIAVYVSQVFLGYFLGSAIFRRFQVRSDEPTAVKKSTVMLPMLLGIIVISLVFDFFFGPMVRGTGFALPMLLGVVRVFLTVWPLGAIIIVKLQHLREREQ